MKKTLVMLLVALFAVTTVFAEGTSEKQEKYTLTIGNNAAVDSLENRTCELIAEKAAELSNGRLELQVFPASQLGDFGSMMASTSEGSQDIVWGDLTWLSNVVKDYNILSMGYAFRDQAHMNNFMHSEVGDELKQELLDKENIILLTDSANSLPRVTVSNFPVSSPADLRAQKMRVPGIPIFVDVWTAVGTKPTSVAWGEVYLALQQGVVDAMECGYEFIYPGKFYEYAPYITLTNHVRGLRGMLVNNDSYNRLPSDLQDVLLEAGLAGEDFYNEQLNIVKDEHTQLLLDAGCHINEVDLGPFQDIMAPLAVEEEAKGVWSTGLYEKVQAL